jgi:hypothetical protein
LTAYAEAARHSLSDSYPGAAESGFQIIRESKHTVMSNGVRMVVIPRHNPINAFTMGKITKDAGFTIDEFKQLI